MSFWKIILYPIILKVSMSELTIEIIEFRIMESKLEWQRKE